MNHLTLAALNRIDFLIGQVHGNGGEMTWDDEENLDLYLLERKDVQDIIKKSGYDIKVVAESHVTSDGEEISVPKQITIMKTDLLAKNKIKARMKQEFGY